MIFSKRKIVNSLWQVPGRLWAVVSSLASPLCYGEHPLLRPIRQSKFNTFYVIFNNQFFSSRILRIIVMNRPQEEVNEDDEEVKDIFLLEWYLVLQANTILLAVSTTMISLYSPFDKVCSFRCLLCFLINYINYRLFYGLFHSSNWLLLCYRLNWEYVILFQLCFKPSNKNTKENQYEKMIIWMKSVLSCRVRIFV